MAEQRFCKPLVGGSIPLASSTTRKLSLIFNKLYRQLNITPHKTPLIFRLGTTPMTRSNEVR